MEAVESRQAGNGGVGVYERLRADILSLHLLPGERISERALEARLGSSRTPIREALLRLEVEGLVSRAGRSLRVAPIDLAELLEVFEYREVIEAEAVRLACRRAKAKDLAEVARMLDRLEGDESPETWFDVGTEVHVSFARLSGNRFLARAVQDTVTRIARARWMMAKSEQGRADSLREHREILQFISQGQAEEAAAAVIAHTRIVRDTLVAALREGQRSYRAHGLAVLDRAVEPAD
ncbi:GntR family transcriptional regulator [Aquibaculum sediminis]|uniref:GntR family transcriptional regulator n=1 Tax=Aquibaculum sediminis TaxID=3231907 RepID=UPI0034546F85